jgi:hypothetical protein
LDKQTVIDTALEIEIEAAMQKVVDRGEAVWVDTDEGRAIQLTAKGYETVRKARGASAQ